MLKVTKLDRRHNGYNVFKYIVEVNIPFNSGRDQRMAKFKELRAWLWENFGPGCELDYVKLDFHRDRKPGEQIGSVERWAWQTSHGEERLYLKTDAEMSLLQLKWS